MPKSYPNRRDTFADHFIDEEKCAATLRQLRWPDKVTCPYCGSTDITNVELEPIIHRYRCNACKQAKRPKVTFNDKTETIFAGSKLSLATWFYGITLVRNKASADVLVAELQVKDHTADRMMSLIQGSIFLSRDISVFKSTTESDEVYITAGGLKGNGQFKPKNREPRKRGLKKRGAPPGTTTGRRS